MLEIARNLQSLQYQDVHRYAKCWEIVRTDGVEYHFTDHNASIELSGDTYAPANGMDVSALEKPAGLRKANREVRGVLDSTALSHDDLRAGRFRDAMVTEQLVDWSVPWAGVFEMARYWIAETIYSRDMWVAEMVGIETWLRQRVGRSFTNNCDAELGDSRCGVDLVPLTDVGTVTAINTQRRVFETDLTEADSWYALGNLVWTSGANDGLKFEVQKYNNADGKIFLWLKTPYDIQVGDDFTVHPGCNKEPGHRTTSGHCKPKYNNLVNFRGFPELPGTDRLVRPAAFRR